MTPLLGNVAVIFQLPVFLIEGHHSIYSVGLPWRPVATGYSCIHKAIPYVYPVRAASLNNPDRQCIPLAAGYTHSIV
jgi:hypothetical protein